MEKHYKQALLLLRHVNNIFQNTSCTTQRGNEQANIFINSYYDLLETIMENDKDFEKFLMMKHGEDYQWLDDDMPDAFDEWVADMDNDDKHELFISFLTS